MVSRKQVSEVPKKVQRQSSPCEKKARKGQVRKSIGTGAVSMDDLTMVGSSPSKRMQDAGGTEPSSEVPSYSSQVVGAGG